ncbi:hypothetical protein FPOAC1_007488 [Fusarium poae]|uniref:hypothetical protein n=1 Tax=Fusarium poae TaxID=36050 RepID=UPI001CE82EAC|nr:hypothetical protein FPOAC1_007488 [Fusarium poae]KAG8668120.1 hypothetical protein FPOAC1_007488 [Fusarium poae]
MSGHKDAWIDLPLMRELGSLCPQPPAPVKHDKPASDTKAKITKEDEIPDPLKVPDTPAKLLDSELYRWPCWACRIRFFAKADNESTASSKPPKNRLRGITDKAVKDFIIDAESRLAKIKSGELPEEKPKKHKPIIDIDNLGNDTVMTTPEEVEAFLKIHPLSFKGDVENWFDEW